MNRFSVISEKFLAGKILAAKLALKSLNFFVDLKTTQKSFKHMAGGEGGVGGGVGGGGVNFQKNLLRKMQ